jgi:hypothetical protein
VRESGFGLCCIELAEKSVIDVALPMPSMAESADEYMEYLLFGFTLRRLSDSGRHEINDKTEPRST